LVTHDAQGSGETRSHSERTSCAPQSETASVLSVLSVVKTPKRCGAPLK